MSNSESMGYYVKIKDSRKTNLKSYLARDKMHYSQLLNNEM